MGILLGIGGVVWPIETTKALPLSPASNEVSAVTSQVYALKPISLTMIDEAVAVCRRGVAALPDDAMLHCRLGTLLGMQGNRAEAIEEIRKAAELDPNSAEIRAILQAVTQK